MNWLFELLHGPHTLNIPEEENISRFSCETMENWVYKICFKKMSYFFIAEALYRINPQSIRGIFFSLRL